jgi:hypothetical protein
MGKDNHALAWITIGFYGFIFFEKKALGFGVIGLRRHLNYVCH